MNRSLSLFIVFKLFTAPLAAIEVIDLAAAGEETISVDAGPLRIQLENALVSGRYVSSWKVERQELLPLSLEETPDVVAGGESPCATLALAITQVTEAADEEKVKELLQTLRGSLPKCSDPELVTSGKATEAATVRSITFSRPLRVSEKAVVTISRVDANGVAKRSWTRTYVAPAAGRWLNSYGFNFVPDEDERFFTKTVEGEEGKFSIQQQDDREELDYLPSIFFTWIPRQWDLSYGASFGATGGLSFDREASLEIFLGGTLFLGDNLHITLGSVLHQQDRLKGIYDVGDIVGTELTEDQLLDSTYNANVFIGLGFRFSSSPFSRNKDAGDEEEETSGGE